MRIARVIGHVVSTIKEKSHHAFKILVVRPTDLSGTPVEDSFLAVDMCQAGVGDYVLVLQEGNGIRALVNNPKSMVDSVAVGIIDYVEQGGDQRTLSLQPSPAGGKDTG